MRRGMNNWGEFTYKSREGDEVGGFFFKKRERTAGATFVKGELTLGLGMQDILSNINGSVRIPRMSF